MGNIDMMKIAHPRSPQETTLSDLSGCFAQINLKEVGPCDFGVILSSG